MAGSAGPCGLSVRREGHDEYVSIGGQRGSDRFDRRHAVRNAGILHESRIEWIGQREMSKPLAVQSVNGRDAAGNVAAVDEKHEHIVDAVAVQPLRRWTPLLAGPRFDAELMDFDSATPATRRRGFQRASGRIRESSACWRSSRFRTRSARTSARRRRAAGCIRGSDSAADAAGARSPLGPRRVHRVPAPAVACAVSHVCIELEMVPAVREAGQSASDPQGVSSSRIALPCANV